MANTVSRDGHSVHVRRQLIDLLVFLASRPGQVVSKEEIFQAVWPGQHVAESGLARCVSQLRDVFGDDPREPHIIETIPTRGYRLIPRAEPVVETAPAPGEIDTGTEGPAGLAAGISPSAERDSSLPTPQSAPSPVPTAVTGADGRSAPGRPTSSRHRPLLWSAAAVLLVAAAVVGVSVWRAGRASSFVGGDTLLVSFENRTGEQVFDDTLRLALTIQLEQSPHLRVVPEPRVREALSFMKRSPDEPLTRALAMEVCQRLGAQGVLTGTITRLGGYVVGLEGVECPSGRVLVRRQVEVPRREEVIAGLGKVASEIRARLGESVVSVQRHDVPLVQATTPSLEALRALSAGDLARNGGHDVEALESYRRAIDLDPQFALAHARLGVLLLSLTRMGEATAALRKAFELRDRASAGERQFITSYYYTRVVRDPLRAVSALEAWRNAYPKNAAARLGLAELYPSVGRLEEGLAEAREALRLEPGSAVATAAIVDALIGLERLDEAKQVALAAIASGHGGVSMRLSLLQIAFAQGDADGMRRQTEWAASNPAAEAIFATQRASMAVSGGRLKEGAEFWRRRAARAEERGDRALAALTTAGAAIHEALAGDVSEVKRLTAIALDQPQAPDTVLRAAFALALAGQTEAADGAFKRYLAMPDVEAGSDPQYRPSTEALIDIARGRPDAAIERLGPFTAREVGFACVPTYVRGLAHLSAKRPKAAVEQFAFITSRRGSLGSTMIYPLAWLQLARAKEAAGDAAGAKDAYDRFFDLWKNADQAAPALLQAKAERFSQRSR